MTDEIISTSPESTDLNALKVAVFNYTHPTLGSIKVPYTALVDMPSFVIVLTGSTVGADKNHLTLFNGSSRRIRIRKIEASANITAAITGATIMLTVQGINTPAPTGGTDITSTIRPLSTNFESLPSGIVARSAPTTVSIVANYNLIIPKPLHVEEAVTTVGDYIQLFNKDNEASSIQLANNEGIVIRQGSLAGAGAINLAITLALD